MASIPDAQRGQGYGLALGSTLLPPRPNPARSTASIEFELPAARQVSLEIIDLAGRRVRRLVGGRDFPPGHHQLLWDGLDDAARAVPAGVYTVRLTAGSQTTTRRSHHTSRRSDLPRWQPQRPALAAVRESKGGQGDTACANRGSEHLSATRLAS
jgi:hypothetical protein